MGDIILLTHPAVAGNDGMCTTSVTGDFSVCSSHSQGAHGKMVVEVGVNLLLPLEA